MDEGILYTCLVVSYIARRLNPLLELMHINVSSRPITELSLITQKTHGLSKCTLHVTMCS